MPIRRDRLSTVSRRSRLGSTPSATSVLPMAILSSIAFDQKPHGESRRMPAACRQTTEDCVPRRIFVEMEWLGIELGGESLDLLLVYPQSPGTEGLPHREVFEISPTHFALPTRERRQAVRTPWHGHSKCVRPLSGESLQAKSTVGNCSCSQ